MGVIFDSSRQRYVQVIERFKARGCDAVALACTEMAWLVTPDVSPPPTLNSTVLLAHAALEVALGRDALPTWRGGPLDAR
jgi:aspartate racemase